MELLTIDNARDILKKGEIYRIGANALNVLEFTYEHKGFETKNPNYKKLPPFLKDAETLYLDGKINWLDVDMEEQKTDYRFHAVKKHLVVFSPQKYLDTARFLSCSHIKFAKARSFDLELELFTFISFLQVCECVARCKSRAFFLPIGSQISWTHKPADL